MPDPLVDELRDLAAWLAVPDPLDQRAAVRARLEARAAGAPGGTAASPRARRRLAAWPWARRWLAAAPDARRRLTGTPRGRRWLAAATATLVAVVVAVVPPARVAVADAVDRVLRFAGVEIRDEPADPGGLPLTPSPLPSVRSAALDEARRLARFPVRVPVALGVPDEVRFADPWPDGAPRVVSLTYRSGAVRIDEFDGRIDGHFMKTASGADYVSVDGEFAVWVPAPHPVVYIDREGRQHTEGARLAGPTLIWTDDVATYRLEGIADLGEALAVAESMT